MPAAQLRRQEDRGGPALRGGLLQGRGACLHPPAREAAGGPCSGLLPWEPFVPGGDPSPTRLSAAFPAPTPIPTPPRSSSLPSWHFSVLSNLPSCLRMPLKNVPGGCQEAIPQPIPPGASPSRAPSAAKPQLSGPRSLAQPGTLLWVPDLLPCSSHSPVGGGEVGSPLAQPLPGPPSRGSRSAPPVPIRPAPTFGQLDT